MTRKTIIYVPGKNPKPQPDEYRGLLWRALLEGVRRAEPSVHEELAGNEAGFHLIAWNYLYYRHYKDITLDIPWIDALIHKHGPTEQDIRDANSWHKHISRFFYSLADCFPFLIPILPKPIRKNVEELNRYFSNRDGIATQIRELIKQVLRPRLQNGEQVMIIAHSMGSVIAYDCLWELSYQEDLPGKIDCMLTIGSPLGMSYVQKRLLGHAEQGSRRYPGNLRHWINLSSVGDVVALDRSIRDDFGEMLDYGMIDDIEDHCGGIYNFFRNHEGLNCHRSYGYLVNPAVGAVIARWWRRC